MMISCAALTFFGPVTICGRIFLDAGYLANNPIEEVWIEAQETWPGEKGIDERIDCLVTIGSGKVGLTSMSGGVLNTTRALATIVTDTETSARRFVKQHIPLVNSRPRRYFRLNVERGLDGVEFDNADSYDLIASATTLYLDLQEVEVQVKECAIVLRKRFEDATE
jgi:hypothetical protein